MIQLKTYSINNNLTITNEVLTSFINTFWTDIFNVIQEEKHLLLMCKVQFSDETMGYRTLGHLRKVNFNDRELFIDYLSQRLTILNDSYVTHPISNITFSYIVREGLCTDNDRALLQDLTNKSLAFHHFNNMKLPVSMNPSEYGNIEVSNYVQVNGETMNRFIVNSGTKTYRIDSNGLVNKVTVLGNIDINWTDTLVNGSLIMREIKKSTIYFMDGEIILRKQILPVKPCRNLGIDYKGLNNIK